MNGKKKTLIKRNSQGNHGHNMTLTRLNPAVSNHSSVSDLKSVTVNGKIYSHLDLSSLTIHQVCFRCNIIFSHHCFIKDKIYKDLGL